MTIRQKLLGRTAYALSAALASSLHIQRAADPDYCAGKPYIFAFWHGKQWLPVLTLVGHGAKRVVLVSPSKDGQILATWLQCLGYETIRGSSRQDNVAALTSMIRRLRAGYSLGFGIDGPIGPIYKVKPGMTYLSQKFQIPIVPVGSAFERSWIFERAWDRYELPKPFTRAALYLAQPWIVPKTESLDQSNQRLEAAIHEAELSAQALLKHV